MQKDNNESELITNLCDQILAKETEVSQFASNDQLIGWYNQSKTPGINPQEIQN